MDELTFVYYGFLVKCDTVISPTTSYTFLHLQIHDGVIFAGCTVQNTFLRMVVDRSAAPESIRWPVAAYETSSSYPPPIYMLCWEIKGRGGFP